MVRIIVLSIGIAMVTIIGSAAYYLGQRSARSTPGVREAQEESTDERHQHVEQQAETALLRQQLAALRQEVAALKGGHPDRAAEQKPAALPAQDMPSKVERERAREAWHVRMVKVEAEFTDEPRDERWSSTMTSALKDAASKHEAIGKRLQRIDCRSKTCRVEVSDDGSAALTQQLPLFLLQMGNDLPSMQSEQVENGNGQRTTVLYLKARSRT